MKSRIGLLTAVLLLVSAAATVRAQTAAGSPSSQQPTEVTPLEPGKPIERELVGDQAHSYSIALSAGQYLHIVVEQKGIDVVVTFFGPDGKKIAEVDSPNGTQGPEPMSVVTEAAGNHRLEVRSLEAKAEAGRYEAKIEELHTARPQDKSRIAARQAFAQGEQLVSEGSAGSLRKAIDKFQEALPLWRAADDRAREATTLNSIAEVYYSLGERQKSLDFFNQALPLSRAVEDRGVEATTLNNIGVVYASLGEKQKALDFYNQALPLRRAVGDRSGEADTLSNIGFVYDSLGEKQNSLNFYNQALLLSRAVGDRSGEAITLNNIGGVYDSLGEKQKALDFYNQALPLRRAVGDRRGEAATLNNMGQVYYSLGEKQKALDFFNQALPVMRTVGDRSGEADTLSNIGLVYDSLGEKQKALDFYNQALLLSREVGDREGEATTLNNMGHVFYSLGEKQKALDFFNQALPVMRTVGDRRTEATTLSNIGFVYDSLGEKQKALDFNDQALLLSRAVGDREGEAVTLFNLARLERELGNLTESLTNIEAALTIVESLRTKIGSPELRSSYFATVQKYYELYIDLLMRLHKQKPSEGYNAKALQANERGRARSLLEVLIEANADIRQGVDSKMLERERALQQQLNAKAQQQTRLLSGRHTKEQADAIAKEIDALTSEFQQTATAIRQTSPRYAALTQPQPLNLTEIQDVLDADTLLLAYSLGEECSFLWAVTPTNISSYELPKREMIETVAKRVYQLLNARNEFTKGETKAQQQARITQADVEYPAAAKQLSQMVLAPVATHLGRKRLLIVSDGALQFIPFAALPDPAPTRARRAVPLVVSHELVSLPSASTLAVLRREQKDRKPATKVLAVLADPVFTRDDDRVKIKLNERSSANSKQEDSITQTPQAGDARVTQANERRQTTETYGSRQLVKEQLAKSAQESNVTDAELRIARLPGTRREAMQIVALVPERQRKLALDFAASRTTALSNDLSDYRYVHFATHGLLNSIHPELSGIVFSLVDDKGEPEDGFLRAHEVFNLKLSADLVVLSACQTGLGKEVRGEGLISLTRGFMYAGAPRVVVSLWSVDDEATASLMVGFYKEMLSGKMSPAAALRAAQIEVRKQKQRTNPYYWAAFTIQGEWR